MKSNYTKEYAYAYCELADLKTSIPINPPSEFEISSKILTDCVNDSKLGLNTGYSSAIKKVMGDILDKYHVDIKKDSVTVSFKCKF